MDKLPLILVVAALLLFGISAWLEKAVPLRLAYAGAACYTAYGLFGGLAH